MAASCLLNWISELTDRFLNHHSESEVAVISIIGKSQIRSERAKTTLINQVLDCDVFSQFELPTGNGGSLCQIDAHYSVSSKCIFLSLTSSMDVFTLANACLNESYLRDVGEIICSLLSDLSDHLKDIPNISKSWIQNGRPCSPRMLYVLRQPPVRSDPDKRVNPVDKLTQALEEQIYRILRKSRVITNTSIKSLFCVPCNDRYVNLISAQDESVDVMTWLMDMVEFYPDDTKVENDGDHLDDLRDFLQTHISAAHSDVGFNDNIGRTPSANYFELPTLELFVNVMRELVTFLFDADSDCLTGLEITSKLSAEIEFSERRCTKVFPLAKKLYEEGLPPFYTRIQHESNLSLAIQELCSQARGPAVDSYQTKLILECERIWHDGRRACEILSLTGNDCINKVHILFESEQTGNNVNVPVMKHTNKIKYLSTCNCGIRQRFRDDPFDIKVANFDFYESTEFFCCKALEHYQFPIFQPSVLDAKAAKLIHDLANKAEQLKIVTQSQEHHDSKAVSNCSFDTFFTKRPQSDLGDTGQRFDSGAMSSAHDSQLSQPEVVDGDHTKEDRVEGDVKIDIKTQEDDHTAYSSIEGSQLGTNTTDDDAVTSGTDNLTGNDMGVTGKLGISTDGGSLGDHRAVSTNDQFESGGKAQAVDSESTRSARHVQTIESQASTVEYLPGMLHSQSPPGLLPLFPSWALTCIGASSLYTHSSGLRDQPNFTHGSGYLLPWDVGVRVDFDKWNRQMDLLNAHHQHGSTRPGGGVGRRKVTGGKDGTVNVKVFVGLEYECPRGHRFMVSDANKILKHSGPGGPKDSATTLLKKDMPLWMTCSCRIGVLGQLQRIHIITPKAPVYVTLNIKVQPEPPNSSIFCPSTASSTVKLPPSEYWMLRLPFVYVGDDRVYRSKLGLGSFGGKIFKGLEQFWQYDTIF